MEAVSFALPGPERDRLVDAVLEGKKTATSSLLANGYWMTRSYRRSAIAGR